MTALDFRSLAIIHIVERAFRQSQFLEPLSRLGRRIAEKYPSCSGSRALPCVRDAAWHECTRAGTADRDLIANFEGDLATQNVGDLVAVVVKVVSRCSSRRRGFLEHHYALSRLAAQQLERDRSAFRLSHTGP